MLTAILIYYMTSVVRGNVSEKHWSSSWFKEKRQEVYSHKTSSICVSSNSGVTSRFSLFIKAMHFQRVHYRMMLSYKHSLKVTYFLYMCLKFHPFLLLDLFRVLTHNGFDRIVLVWNFDLVRRARKTMALLSFFSSSWLRDWSHCRCDGLHHFGFHFWPQDIKRIMTQSILDVSPTI